MTFETLRVYYGIIVYIYIVETESEFLLRKSHLMGETNHGFPLFVISVGLKNVTNIDKC